VIGAGRIASQLEVGHFGRLERSTDETWTRHQHYWLREQGNPMRRQDSVFH